MNHEKILALYDAEERIAADVPSFVREEVGSVVRHVPTTPEIHGSTGFLTYSQLDAATADQVIVDQIDFFAARKLGISWKLYGHDTPADLADRLIAHGLEPQEPESIMVLDLQRVPPELLEPVSKDVRRIREPERISDLRQVATAVWQDEKQDLFAMIETMPRETPDQISMYVAYHRDKPVSGARLQITEGRPFASLWGGSTLAEYRGQGFYTALLAVRVQEAVERGASFITVDAGPMSKPIVERFGFRALTTACDYDSALEG